jgi:hypothetical protein
MVVNFRAREINRSTRKLVRTFTLNFKKKMLRQFMNPNTAAVFGCVFIMVVGVLSRMTIHIT